MNCVNTPTEHLQAIPDNLNMPEIESLLEQYKALNPMYPLGGKTDSVNSLEENFRTTLSACCHDDFMHFYSSIPDMEQGKYYSCYLDFILPSRTHFIHP